MKVKTSLNKVIGKNSQLVKQSAVLFSANILNIALGLGVSIFNTRFLGPEAYGDFKFLLNLFTLSVLIFTGGYFITGGRIVALDKFSEKKQELIGSLFFITIIASAIISVAMFIYSFFQDELFGTQNLGWTIRIFSLFLFVYPFETFIEKLLEGDNRISDLALTRIIPRFIYLGIIFIVSLETPVGLNAALIVHMLSLGMALAYVYYAVKPSFHNLKENVALVREMNKHHGMPMYLGTLIGQGSGYLGTMIISYFLDNTNVGYYMLAQTIATPLVMIPQSLGTVSYKKFANENKISGKVTLWTIASTLGVFLVFNLLVEYVVLFVYSEEYYPVIEITRLVAFALILQGFCFYINRFLSSQGLGKQLRDADLIRGVINIVSFFLLIRWLGIEGACYSLILSNIAVLIYLIIKYKQYIKKSENSETTF